MENNLLSQFGESSEARVSEAVSQLRAGKGVLLVDDEGRENEGDIIFAAEKITAESMNQLIRDCSGIVCLCLTSEHLTRLNLSPMVAPEDNTSSFGTGFTVSIEAAKGVTTGVSAQDRVTTIKAAIDSEASPEDLARPGHVFPIAARDGGVRERRGHTEGTVELMRIAGLEPAGVLCELMNDDGTMARLPQVCEYARTKDMMVLSIEDIATYLNAQ